MANALYPNFKENLLKANIDFDTITLAALLVDGADYTYSATHEFLSDVPLAGRVASVNLASVTVTDGVVDAADATFTSVTGDPCESLIIYNNTGTAGTSHLIAFYDTGVTGLPVTPNGGNINITFNASGLFSL